MENQELLSLYDYLGRAAGHKLGTEVNDAAQAKQIKYGIREISNPKYTGKVMLYPKSFLDEYFKVSQEDDLPF
jgi:hypothetical protein